MVLPARNSNQPQVERRTKLLNQTVRVGDHVIEVKTGSNPRTLDDDRITILGSGSAHLHGPSRGYSAGYLPFKAAPLLGHLGKDLPYSSIVNREQNHNAPTKFEQAFRTAHPGAPTNLVKEYREDGDDPEALDWEGFCDRWSYSALDPRIVARVNQPLAYKGSFFSVAELRALSTFLGGNDQDFTKTLAIGEPTAKQELLGVLTLINPDVPGFFANVDGGHSVLGGHHFLRRGEVWNQPFVSADVWVKEISGPLESLAARLRHPHHHHHLHLLHHESPERRFFEVEVTAQYVKEAKDGDNYEGDPVYDDRKWTFTVQTDLSGAVTEVSRKHHDSDRRIDNLFVPYRTGEYGDEHDAKFFFTELLPNGVPVEKVKRFERHLGRLLGQEASLSDEQKSEFLEAFSGIRNAYPDADLTRAVAPLGLTAQDFS